MIYFARLYLRALLTHRIRTLATILVLALASGLTLAVAAVDSSFHHSVTAQQNATAGTATAIVVSNSADGMNEATVVSRTGGAPLVSTQVSVDGVETLLLGADARAATFATKGLSLQGQAAPPAGSVVIGSELAQEEHLRAGAMISVRGAGPVEIARISRIIEDSQINGGQFLAARLATAQSLSGRPGQVDEVLLHASTSGRARLSQELHGVATVLTPSELVSQGLAGVLVLQQAFPLLAALVLVVGAFLVFTTITNTNREQIRVLAIARALGATSKQLGAAIMAQAIALSLCGVVVGIPAGIGMAHAILHSVPVSLLSSIPTRVQLSLNAPGILEAVGATVIAASVAGALATRRISEISPLDAIRSAADLEGAPPQSNLVTSRGLLCGGVILVVCGIAAVLSKKNVVLLPGAALIVGGWVLVTYTASGAFVAAPSIALKRFGVQGQLASWGIARAPRRAWATITAVSLGVGMVIGLAGSGSNTLRSAEPTFSSISKVDLLVQTAPAASVPTTLTMPSAWGAQLASLPGVVSALPIQFDYAAVGGRRVMIEGAAPASKTPMVFGDSAAITGDSAIVSTQVARYMRLKVGSTLSIRTSVGLRNVTVRAVRASFLWPNGVIAIPIVNAQRWLRSGATAYELQVSPSVPVGRVEGEISSFTHASGLPISVITGAQSKAAAEKTIKQASQVFTALGAAGLVVAALMILSALLASVIERWREFGVLRAIGATRKQIRLAVGLEAAGLVGLATLAAIPLGLLFQFLSANVNRSKLGFPVQMHLAPIVLIVAAVTALIMSLFGSLPPITRVGRLQVVEALRDE